MRPIRASRDETSTFRVTAGRTIFVMRIVIAGGSGQVGTVLAREFHRRGDAVTVLSRRPAATVWKTVAWDGRTLDAWRSELDGADVVINLTGRSVNCRYTPENRREILASRLGPTRAIGDAIALAARPPRVWLQSSTATIYEHRYDAPNGESTGIIGGREADAPDTWRFSIEVATAWEEACNAVRTPDTRKVLMRSAMIMSPGRGGIFDTLLGLVRKGLGGPAGDGRQYVSWIEDVDFIRAIDWLIAHDELSGAVNLAAPNPLPFARFMRILREAAGVRIGLPATKWMLEIGALLMGTETELILKSRRVVPERLLADGFTFEFPQWEVAAPDLYRRWRS
jgi:uncharacterized protein